MSEIKLLDCTLRDGGYVNDWNFGSNNIINIFERLVSAGIDIIEVGFLDERRPFDMHRSIMPDTHAVNQIFGGLDKGASMIVGMIDYGTCSLSNICNQEDSFLDGIRVIFKKQKMHEAIAFCGELKRKGYKVFAQAVSITSYADDEFDELLSLVNALEPYAFSLVDTYGLLHKQKLMHYYVAADQKLKKSIGLGYHAHNNFQLAYANCVELLEAPPQGRLLLVDGTLYGMGKSAGNAPIELLVTYMNEHGKKHYHASQLLEAIDVTIMEIYKEIPWGYNFKFFISASHDCHPNYVSYLMDKQKLSVKSIHEILDTLEEEKKLLYDQDYIERLYLEYQKRISGTGKSSISEWVEKLRERPVLLIGPGKSIVDEKERVAAFIEAQNPIVISINFLPEAYPIDYVFVCNAKRYVQLSTALSRKPKIGLVATSNVTRSIGEFDYTVNYADLIDEEALVVDNAVVMLVKLLSMQGIHSLYMAGFDGYITSQTFNYFNPNIGESLSKKKAAQLNEDTVKSFGRIPGRAVLHFITETQYDLNAMKLG